MRIQWDEFEGQIAQVEPGNNGSIFFDDSADFTRVCGCADCGYKNRHDGSGGSINGPQANNGPDIAGNATTTASVAVNGSATSFIDFANDTDWFAVVLTSTQFYRFDLVSSGVAPLDDAYLVLRDSGGTQLAFNDDASGATLNSQLIFQAQGTGTYFLDAQAFGVGVGQYTLSVTAIAAPPPPPPPPPPSVTPLDSISSNRMVTGSPIIDVYFANAGETFQDGPTTVTALAYTAAQRAAFTGVFADISSAINLTFRVTTDAAQADFKLYMANLNDPDLFGFMQFPNGGAQIAAFNQPSTAFSDLGVNKGGLGYVTYVHELGHGLGLAHPHDTGGGSTIMTGVTSSGSTGPQQLNQGVFTTMTYLDGWVTSPFGRVSSLNLGYGMQGTFMPLDVAALQQKYGANTNFNATSTTYALLDTNGVGTFFSTIWDTGGTDTLFYAGSRNANLDLRAATLQYEIGGGGYVSYATGIHGGYVIANGVVVEDAIGGSGNDTLTGNAAANSLTGNGGDDVFILSAGADTIRGGAGNDVVSFVSWGSAVVLDLASATTFSVGATTISDVEGAIGSAFDDVLYGTTGINRLEGGAGNDILEGREGDDTLDAGTNTTIDYVYGGTGNDRVLGSTGAADILLGEAGDDVILAGAGGANYIYGGTGSNTMSGTASLNVYISEGTDDRMDSSSVAGTSSSFYYRYSDGVSRVFGGNGVDQFIGGNANSNDSVFVGGGDDFVFGGNGNDLLVGGNGNDVIIGQNGNDTLEGGAGVNLLWANDSGNDQIVVSVTSLLPPGTGDVGGTQVLEFFEAGGTNDVVRLLGSNLTAFSGIEALRNSIGAVIGNNMMLNQGSGAQLYLNLGASQTAIWFQGVSAYSLTSGDFLFG